MDPSAKLPSTPATPKQLVVALVLLALVVRGGVLALAPEALSADPDAYRRLAENLLQHGCFGHDEIPTAYRPPLYPMLLAVCLALDHAGWVGIALLHLATGLATVWLVFRLGRRWGLDGYALVAAALVACDPILLSQSTLVMTETVATLLTCLALVGLTLAAERPSPVRGAVAGGLLALAALCRPTFLVCAAASALVLPVLAPSGPQRLKVFASFMLAAAVVLAPWTVRNQIRFGRPIVGTTHGGYTLLLGNNPQFYDYLRSRSWGVAWEADGFHQAWSKRLCDAAPAGELAADRLAYADACQTIRRQPGTFFYSCLVRGGRLWGPLPHQVGDDETTARRWSRYGVGLWYLAELALAAIGMVALGKRAIGRRVLLTGWLWGLLVAASFTAVHSLFWSNMRMRAPLMPVVALAAAAGIAWITSARLRRKSNAA